MPLILLFLISQVYALEVVKKEFRTEIHLKIVKAEPESFETYSLINHNGKEMILVCAGNRVYGNNKKPFIEYRNFYNEVAGNFELESNEVCLDMGKFIESAHYAISDEKPFLITLSIKNLKVKKIEYPGIDRFADEGEVRDLLPKPLRPMKKIIHY